MVVGEQPRRGIGPHPAEERRPEQQTSTELTDDGGLSDPAHARAQHPSHDQDEEDAGKNTSN
ncbi:MAG: hypothetical protein O3C27_00090 [Actinomycetota bacterium]|nr:hypothetical protein [Actinomycetota bacterium]